MHPKEGVQDIRAASCLLLSSKSQLVIACVVAHASACLIPVVSQVHVVHDNTAAARAYEAVGFQVEVRESN